jgi:hypothetical protein
METLELFEPTWDSLRKHPTTQWFKDAKELLRGIARWMAVNSESIYGATIWITPATTLSYSKL